MRALGPAPLLEQLTEDRVEEHRFLGCRRYDACLAFAARGDWESWTCSHCLRFERRHRWAAAQAWLPRAEAPAAAPPPVAASFSAAGPGPAGASPCSAAPTPRMSHSVEEGPGRRRISVLAPSMPELFVEAGRAAAEVVRGLSDDVGGTFSEEVAIAASDREALLGEWVRQLVLRSEHAGARISEHDIVYLSEGRIVANVRGSLVKRVGDAREVVTCREPSIQPGWDGVRGTVELRG